RPRSSRSAAARFALGPQAQDGGWSAEAGCLSREHGGEEEQDQDQREADHESGAERDGKEAGGPLHAPVDAGRRVVVSPARRRNARLRCTAGTLSIDEPRRFDLRVARVPTADGHDGDRIASRRRPERATTVATLGGSRSPWTLECRLSAAP